MKRKTYEKKVRNLLHQLNQMQPVEKRLPDLRPNRPDFGFIPEVGKYAGEPIISTGMGCPRRGIQGFPSC